ncbi:MAG: hypothetical protein WCF23_06735 [Candidatus Nitrosopolaris sp.]
MKKIFLPTYSGKTEPDSKVKGTNKCDDEKTVIQTEERIAVITQQRFPISPWRSKKRSFPRSRFWILILTLLSTRATLTKRKVF